MWSQVQAQFSMCRRSSSSSSHGGSMSAMRREAARRVVAAARRAANAAPGRVRAAPARHHLTARLSPGTCQHKARAF